MSSATCDGSRRDARSTSRRAAALDRRVVLLAPCLFAAACATEPLAAKAPALPPVAPAPSAPPVDRHDPSAQILAARAPIDRKLHPHEMHAYEVKLEQGEVLFATVEQRGVDLFVRTFDPEGKQLAEIDSPNGTMGPEPIQIQAKASGVYRFEVRPGEWPGYDPFAGKPEGAYQARVDEIASARAFAERQAKKTLESTRLFALWRAIRDEGKPAEERFWKEIAGKAPLVEPIEGDARGDVRVTFVFHGDAETKYVGLLAGPGGGEKPLGHLDGSDVWYLSARMPRDARVTYAFVRAAAPPSLDLELSSSIDRYDRPALVTDPLNPARFMERSFVELPDAPKQPWIAKKDVPHGALVEEKIESEKLREVRKLTVYTPPGFDPKRGSHPLVVAFDGDAYGAGPGAIIPLPTIVDNLIAAKKIPTVVLALVPNTEGGRQRDLGMSAAFADFVASEVVPMLRKKYRASSDPKLAVITGSSLGGLQSVFTALRHPEVFGNVLSQSGAFWLYPDAFTKSGDYATEPGRWILDLAKAPKRQAVSFYLEAGRFETSPHRNILASNRRLRDVLVAKGYSVSYSEFDGGHDYACWRGSIADGLMALLTPPKR